MFKRQIVLLICIILLPQIGLSNIFKDSSKEVDLDSCSATQVLDIAIEKTGVDLYSTTLPRKVWTCSKKEGRVCPGAGFKCYSNYSSGFPSICVKNSKAVAVQGVEGVKFARFDGLAVFKRPHIPGSRRGADHSKWTMDQEGCDPVNFHSTWNHYQERSQIAGQMDFIDCANDIVDYAEKKDCHSSSKSVLSKRTLRNAAYFMKCLEGYPQLNIEKAREVVRKYSTSSDSEASSSVK